MHRRYSWKKYYFKYSLIVLIVILISSCRQDDKNEPEPEPESEDTTASNEENYRYSNLELVTEQTLINNELVASYTKQELEFALSQTDYADMDNLIKYPVDVYRLTYNTNSPTNDGAIEASGLLCVPSDTSINFPGLSAHHGTIFRSEDAPSAYSIENLDASDNLELLASAGYVTFMPDYIGFGASGNLLHPYYNYAATVTTVVNFIRAGKELAQEIGIRVSDDLFLFGYSEGGYVSMATHQYIEQTSPAGINLKATAAGAGGYNLQHVTDLIVENDTYETPAYLAYILYSYTTYVDQEASLDTYFQQPYADRIPRLFDDTNEGGNINSELNNSLDELIQPDFLSALRSGEENNFTKNLKNNSIQALALEGSIRLYHGTSDDIVPYVDSEQFYKTQQQLGANNITLHPISGGTHRSSFVPMVKDVIPWFDGK